jgi:hypothetical protein
MFRVMIYKSTLLFTLANRTLYIILHMLEHLSPFCSACVNNCNHLRRCIRRACWSPRNKTMTEGCIMINKFQLNMMWGRGIVIYV